jgi:hypothetical protein
MARHRFGQNQTPTHDSPPKMRGGCVPLECTDRDTPYKLLYQAREHLGKAHDLITNALMSHRGQHHDHVTMAMCGKINDLIGQLNDACGVASRE